MTTKALTQYVRQIVSRKLGSYASNTLGNDIYFLIEAINHIIADVGEDFVKEVSKKEGLDFDKIRITLTKMSKLSTEVKVFYDPLLEKKPGKSSNDLQVEKFRRYYKKTVKRILLIQKDIYDILNLLTKYTTLGNTYIPSDAFKVPEHIGARKIDTEKTKIIGGVVKE